MAHERNKLNLTSEEKRVKEQLSMLQQQYVRLQRELQAITNEMLRLEGELRAISRIAQESKKDT